MEDRAKVVEGNRNRRMIWTEMCFADGQRAPIQDLGLLQAMLSADGVGQIVCPRGNVGMIRPDRRFRDCEGPPQQAFCLTCPTLIGKECCEVGELVGNVGVIRAERPFQAVKASAIEYFGLRIAPLADMELAEIVRDRRGGNAFHSEQGFLDPKALPELRLSGGQFALLLVNDGQIVERHRHICVLGPQRLTQPSKGVLKKRFGFGITRLAVPHPSDADQRQKRIRMITSQLSVTDGQNARQELLGFPIVCPIDRNVR